MKSQAIARFTGWIADSPTPIKPRRFYGSVEIDINRPVKAFDTILNSVVMELQETATGHARGCQDCGGQRFEFPQLHQVVRTSGHDFLRHGIVRHSRDLRRQQRGVAQVRSRHHERPCGPDQILVNVVLTEGHVGAILTIKDEREMLPDRGYRG